VRCGPKNHHSSGIHAGGVTGTVLARGYRPFAVVAIITFSANVAKRQSFTTPANLYLYETILQRLPQHLQHIAAELGPFIQEEHAMVGQRHVARHRHLAPADQARIREGMMQRAERAGRDQRRAIAREASDAREVGGVDRCSQEWRVAREDAPLREAEPMLDWEPDHPSPGCVGDDPPIRLGLLASAHLKETSAPPPARQAPAQCGYRVWWAHKPAAMPAALVVWPPCS
jgi:hypothetical protein